MSARLSNRRARDAAPYRPPYQRKPCFSVSRPLVRFPARHASCVWIRRENAAWLVLAGSHGWLHGDYHTARADAEWLASNLGGLPVRSAA
jgi:hypothetical protein